MRRLVLLSLLPCLAVPALAAPAPDKGRVKLELEKLNGTWKVTSAEAEGRKLPAPAIRSFKLIFKGDKFMIENGAEKVEGTFKIDPAMNPRTMDIIPSTGTEAGKVQLAIYQLKGNTLTICGGQSGKGRPKAFKTEPASGHSLLILRRQP